MTIETTYNKSEIVTELKAVYQEVSDLVAAVSEEKLYATINEKWSIGENLEHLILSYVGVASVLKQPKTIFKNFGTPKGPSRTYDGLYQTYKNVLANGQKAPSAFSPKDDSIKTKQELLESWQMIIHKLEQRVNNFWTEEDLETYALPHPALGILTVREMLYATIFHTKHHLESMQKLV